MRDSLEAHYKAMIKAITDGRIISVLSARVHLYGRQESLRHQDSRFSSSGAELSAYLAEIFDYPSPAVYDSARVPRYIAVVVALGPLHEEIHSLFAANYPPTALKKCFASLVAVLREKDALPRDPYIVTTSYDVLERPPRGPGSRLTWSYTFPRASSTASLCLGCLTARGA